MGWASQLASNCRSSLQGTTKISLGNPQCQRFVPLPASPRSYLHFVLLDHQIIVSEFFGQQVGRCSFSGRNFGLSFLPNKVGELPGKPSEIRSRGSSSRFPLNSPGSSPSCFVELHCWLRRCLRSPMMSTEDNFCCIAALASKKSDPAWAAAATTAIKNSAPCVSESP